MRHDNTIIYGHVEMQWKIIQSYFDFKWKLLSREYLKVSKVDGGSVYDTFRIKNSWFP